MNGLSKCCLVHDKMYLCIHTDSYEGSYYEVFNSLEDVKSWIKRCSYKPDDLDVFEIKNQLDVYDLVFSIKT